MGIKDIARLTGRLDSIKAFSSGKFRIPFTQPRQIPVLVKDNNLREWSQGIDRHILNNTYQLLEVYVKYELYVNYELNTKIHGSLRKMWFFSVKQKKGRSIT